MKYETKIYSLIVKPVSEPIFSEMATIIGVDDEAGGVFCTIEQNGRGDNSNKITIDPEEWPLIKAAVERLMEEWKA